MKTIFGEEFERFLEKELEPAATELEKIADKSRKHLQRLVYTNLVDRFDVYVDKLLLTMVEKEELLEELLKKHKEPIHESEILKWMLSSQPKEMALERLKGTLQNSILRARHSDKVAKLLRLTGLNDNEIKSPRVNAGTGDILAKFKVQNKQIPATIVGYSDWLYSKRNAIVHGGGKNQFLENDLKQLHERFKCTPANSISLKPGSIRNTANFYKNIIEIVES